MISSAVPVADSNVTQPPYLFASSMENDQSIRSAVHRVLYGDKAALIGEAVEQPVLTVKPRCFTDTNASLLIQYFRNLFAAQRRALSYSDESML